jgi:hypothetical protein
MQKGLGITHSHHEFITSVVSENGVDVSLLKPPLDCESFFLAVLLKSVEVMEVQVVQVQVQEAMSACPLKHLGIHHLSAC